MKNENSSKVYDDIVIKPINYEDMVFIHTLMNESGTMVILLSNITTLEHWFDAYKMWEADADEKNYIIFSNNQKIGWIGLNGLLSNTAWIKSVKQLINYKRIKLHVSASEMYPEDYDYSIIFDSVENRKARHKMGKRHNPDLRIEITKGD